MSMVAVTDARAVLHAQLAREAERRRLVSLCAAITGDRAAAEDLAQETLLEAWRNAHKLHDPSGVDRWLAAIARHVCRRWARRRSRDNAVLAAVGAEREPAADEVELELERAELAELLDRALALLPAATRDVLVHRYVHESPHAEIACRLGLSEAAVSMRLARGKLVLRRLLASELATEAAAQGLVDTSAAWRETRVWCPQCGARRLAMRRDAAPGTVAFRCEHCDVDPAAVASELRLENPHFAKLVGDLIRPSAILARIAEWSQPYFAGGAGAEAACTRCDRALAIRSYVRETVHPDRSNRRGLYADCASCGEIVSSSVGALALVQPIVRRFRRDNPRVRAVPPRRVDAHGLPAIVVAFESVLGRARVDVVIARDTLRVLTVHDPSA